MKSQNQLEPIYYWITRTMHFVLQLVLCGLLACLTCYQAYAASFECGKAKTSVEQLICSSNEVSKLDEEIQSTYQDAYQHTSDPASLKAEQRQWLKMRDVCKDADCLTQAYHTRLNDLKTLLAKPKPCFRLLERKWPEVASGHYPVCVDFLNNLNSFCEEAPATKWIKIDPSDKITLPVNSTPRSSCEWKINPAIDTLKVPHWEAINPKAHLKIIQNLYQHYYRDPEEKWEPIPPDMLQHINEGQSRLWHTWIDLDHDGQKEHVVRFDNLPCNKGEQTDFFGLPSRLAVVDDNISKVEAHYEYLRYGSDIVIHDDKAYVMTKMATGGVQVRFKSGLVGFRNHLDLQEPFSARGGYEKGMRSVCVFDYIK